MKIQIRFPRYASLHQDIMRLKGQETTVEVRLQCSRKGLSAAGVR